MVDGYRANATSWRGSRVWWARCEEWCSVTGSILRGQLALLETKQTHQKPSSAYNKEKNQFFAYKQKLGNKIRKEKMQRIIRGDEIQRKPSSRADTRRERPAPTLTFPHSQPHWQITYGGTPTERTSPPRWGAHSFITLRESVSAIDSAEQDTVCFN